MPSMTADEYLNQKLAAAASVGTVEQVKELVAQGAQLDARDRQDGRNAADFAASNRNPEVISWVIAEMKNKGLNPHEANPKDGWTHLERADNSNNLAAMKALIASGAVEELLKTQKGRESLDKMIDGHKEWEAEHGKWNRGETRDRNTAILELLEAAKKNGGTPPAEMLTQGMSGSEKYNKDTNELADKNGWAYRGNNKQSDMADAVYAYREAFKKKMSEAGLDPNAEWSKRVQNPNSVEGRIASAELSTGAKISAGEIDATRDALDNRNSEKLRQESQALGQGARQNPAATPNTFPTQSRTTNQSQDGGILRGWVAGKDGGTVEVREFRDNAGEITWRAMGEVATKNLQYMRNNDVSQNTPEGSTQIVRLQEDHVFLGVNPIPASTPVASGGRPATAGRSQ